MAAPPRTRWGSRSRCRVRAAVRSRAYCRALSRLSAARVTSSSARSRSSSWNGVCSSERPNSASPSMQRRARMGTTIKEWTPLSRTFCARTGSWSTHGPAWCRAPAPGETCPCAGRRRTMSSGGRGSPLPAPTATPGVPGRWRPDQHAAAAAGGRSSCRLLELDIEGAGERSQRADACGLPLALLQLADGVDVDIGPVGELFLREVAKLSQALDAVAHGRIHIYPRQRYVWLHGTAGGRCRRYEAETTKGLPVRPLRPYRGPRGVQTVAVFAHAQSTNAPQAGGERAEPVQSHQMTCPFREPGAVGCQVGCDAASYRGSRLHQGGSSWLRKGDWLS